MRRARFSSSFVFVVLEVVLGSAWAVQRVRDLEVVWAELALPDAEGALLELLRPLDGLEAVFATLRWSVLYDAMLGLVPP